MSQDSHTQSPISQIGDMLDDGLILTDLDGVILSVNPAAVRWFGENLTGQKVFDMINHPNIGELFAQAVDGAKRCEMRYEPTNIIQREFRMRLQRIGDQSVAVLFLDMTLQRNLEKVRRDFVANVSHELRSPLTSLAGFVETMLSDEVPDPAMRMRFLNIMDEEAKRMTRLIDDLLSLSRVEVDEHIIPKNRVNLSELLHSVSDSMIGRAMKKNMNIKVTQPENEESRAVRIDVTNFGEGIEERYLPRLTERFYRVDKARSRQIGGTGLGLAIVKHIVNRHRGDLSINSTLGGATRFSVNLPLAPPSDVAI